MVYRRCSGTIPILVIVALRWIFPLTEFFANRLNTSWKSRKAFDFSTERERDFCCWSVLTNKEDVLVECQVYKDVGREILKHVQLEDFSHLEFKECIEKVI